MDSATALSDMTPSGRGPGSGSGSNSGDNDGTPTLDPSDRTFWIGLVVTILSVISALATYLILTNLTPITPRNDIVLYALAINGVLIVAMIAVIAHQVFGLTRAWQAKAPGARLHIRIVALFSIIAALPALLLGVGATLSFSRTLDTWFVSRTRAIIDNSLEVATAYVEENAKLIRTDVLNMARDFDSAAGLVKNEPNAMQQLLISQAGLRDLPTAHIIGGNGALVIRGLEDKRLPFIHPGPAAMAEAKSGQTPLGASKNERISAIAKLENFPDRYIYASRPVSPELMGYLQRTEENVREYNELRKRRGGLKAAHGLMYLMISLTSLLAAIWSGLWFAGRFVAPIRRLIGAAEDVSRGNLQVVLPEKRGEGDLRRLSETFNTMTRELKNKRDALVAANEQLSDRSRFIEAVLRGVSAGVIGLDSVGNITLISRSAEQLLHIRGQALIGNPLATALPNFAEKLDAAADKTLTAQRPREVTLEIGNEERTFAVRVTEEKQSSDNDDGVVITFDDISDLVLAQRTSAWADVAQRIAHEIKNPLTPIQLSAERLKRKYGPAIVEDRETFDRLTDTIVRQVGDLKTMVDEFASFARMPAPEIARHDLRDAVQEPSLLFQEGHTSVVYEVVVPDAPVPASFDRRLITQAVTNLVKNATESVEAAAESGARGAAFAPRVRTVLSATDAGVTIAVADNGLGLPKQNKSRLLEPYVTTKGAKGTGLGLAMVKKITEQHGGTLALEDAPPDATGHSGAQVVMRLPAPASTTPPGVPNARDPKTSGKNRVSGDP